MRKIINRFGKLITASFFVMGIGLIVFLLSFPLYIYYDIDTDIVGFLIVLLGLVIFIVGIIRRKKLTGVKRGLLIALASILSLPILSLVASLIYYLITGKELGS
jgi:tetrahydromethanopterin S-methyltransferase subunit E